MKHNIFSSSEVGKNIRNIRKSKCMTQKELAEDVGISIQTIQKYEAAKVEMSLQLLVSVADALDCHVYDLIGMKFELNHERMVKVLEKVEQLKEHKEFNAEIEAKLIQSLYM